MSIEELLQILQDAKAQGVTHVDFKDMRRHQPMSYNSHLIGKTTHDGYFFTNERLAERAAEDPDSLLETRFPAICLVLDVVVL